MILVYLNGILLREHLDYEMVSKSGIKFNFKSRFGATLDVLRFPPGDVATRKSYTLDRDYPQYEVLLYEALLPAEKH